MKTCQNCRAPITRQSKTGLCRTCVQRDPVVKARQMERRLATLSAQSLEERLARFQIVRGEDECWGWSGCHNGVGYPMMRIHKRARLGTHVALECDGRARPSDRYVACHKCDNPICTNPAHLWWGTEKQNMQDASEKKRLKGNRFGRPRSHSDGRAT